MIKKKLNELIEHYILEERTKGEIASFCNQYDIIFSNFSDELFNEVNYEIYNIFEEIYMIVDLYEPDLNIRNSEPYCLNEDEVIEKIKLLFKKIK